MVFRVLFVFSTLEKLAASGLNQAFGILGLWRRRCRLDGAPDERLGIDGVVFGDEAVDGGLQIHDRREYA